MKFISKLLAAIMATATMISCGGNNTAETAAELAGEVKIDGSSTVYPISEAVAEEFMTANPKVRVTVGESGTGAGFKKFGRGEIDVQDASRSIKSKEDSTCKANNIEYIELLVAYDGLAIVVNPQNTWCADMTAAELKKLWEPAAQGTVMRWNQIRADWPNEEIHLFGAGTQSGTFDYFTEAIVGESKSCRGDYTASEDDNVLVQGIASDKLALGFFGLAYYENNKDKLKLVAVDNGAGAVLPSLETVRSKSYAPLSRPLFIYVNSVSAERAEVQAFSRYYLDNSEALSKSVGYVPLTTEETAAERAKLETFLSAHATTAK